MQVSFFIYLKVFSEKSVPEVSIIHFYWEASTSGGVDSNETNQAGAAEVIMSRLCDELKPLYFHFNQSAYDDKPW